MKLFSRLFPRLFSLWFQVRACLHGSNVALFLLALIPRLLWALDAHPPPFSDMEDYYLCAVNALRGEPLAMSAERQAYRAPGYPLFMLGVFTLFPADRLSALRVVQSVLDALSAVLLFSIAKRVMGPLRILRNEKNALFLQMIAFMTAWHYAWMSEPIFFSSLLMTETLFTFLLLCWIRLLYASCWFQSPGWCSIPSLLLGILALVRPISLVFLPLLVFEVFLRSSQAKWKRWVWVPLLAWLLPVLPWTVRNYVLLGSVVLLTTNSGLNFYIGHHHDYGYYRTGGKEQIRIALKEELGYVDEVAEDRLFFQLGMEEMMRYPHLLIQHSLQKLYYLYLEDEPPWPWREYHRGEGPGFYRFVPYLHWSWHPSLLLLMLAGIMYAFIKKLPQRSLLAVLGLYTLACLIYFARTRFRVPIEPVLILYSWLGIVSLVETIYSLFWYWNHRMADSKDPEHFLFQRVTLRR